MVTTKLQGKTYKNTELITGNKRTNSVTQKMYADAVLLRIRAKIAMKRNAEC